MNIRDSIRILAAGNEEIYCKICKVDEVYKEKRTIDCTPISMEEAPILDVNLQANQASDKGIVIYPAKGSYVAVAFLNQGAGVVVLTEEIDDIEIVTGNTSIEINGEEIILNGGGNGGLVQINELTGKLNDLISAFNSHTHSISSGGITVKGSATTQTNDAPITIPAIKSEFKKFSAGEYENISIKH